MTAERPRVVFDTMVMFQWATLPPERRPHASHAAVADGSVAQYLDRALLDEIRDVLTRPALREKFGGTLSGDRVARFIATLRSRCMWLEDIPALFSLPAHKKDDHVFHLAIAAKADRLVTWETRLLDLESKHPRDWSLLNDLAPQLRVVTPQALTEELRSE